MQTQDFLFELGTEELPPKALKSFIKSLAVSVYSQLEAQGISFNKDASQIFGSPRRLAIRVADLAASTPKVEETVWGPPAKIAFDDSGKPSKAAEAFANKNNLPLATLQDCIQNDGKADKLCCTRETGGDAVVTLLPGIIETALKELPIPKRMRWGARKAEFVRPVHWVVMLYGDSVIDCTILEHQAGRITFGHRFHAPGELTINQPADYQDLLKNHYVLACFAERRNSIRKQLEQKAAELNANIVAEADLLDEVNALVEWPVALVGAFEERFLAVPAEALIASMSEHQKYFHVLDNNGKLLPKFVFIANLESQDAAQIIDGNERVIRPRLADAAFFFETDKKQTLASRCEKLQGIVFQAKLGSIYDKCQRMASLGEYIANIIGADVSKTCRAAELCKADLVSDMVLEFDNMQGIAGRYYALNDGEDVIVADALEQHYWPKFAGDRIPETLEACTVALADRIDTLVGIFAIGQKPTGSKDPFALRRASIGALSIILGKSLDIDLLAVLKQAQALHQAAANNDSLTDEVFAYMIERFRAMYQDQNIPLACFNAVQAKQLTNPYDIDLRVAAVNAFALLGESQQLAAANKRVSNILAKAELSGSHKIDLVLLVEPAEQNLAKLISHMETVLEPHLKQRDYTEALCALAELQQPVDTFFDEVMVNADDEKLRNNRLAMLTSLRELFLNIADISLLAPEKNA